LKLKLLVGLMVSTITLGQLHLCIPSVHHTYRASIEWGQFQLYINIRCT